MKIGFIGIGVMGSAMVDNLLKAGHEVFVTTRTKAKADGVVSRGAVFLEDFYARVSEFDVVITIVGMPSDVQQVYLGENGIIKNSRPGQVFIDMTTSIPAQAIEIYQAAKNVGCDFLDAPVSGGQKGAIDKTLTIMVGGDKEVFDKNYELFMAMGTNVVYQGVASMGQHTKMCNQIALANTMMSTMELIAYAKSVGLDVETVYKSVCAGSAQSTSMDINILKVLTGDMQPGFYIKHFIKDLKIALEVAKASELQLPGCAKALELYEALANLGDEDLGTQALIKCYKCD